MQYVACLLSLILLLQSAPARRAAGIHLKRGDLLMSQNKVIEALASYDKAVEADPAWAAAYVKRGMARRGPIAVIDRLGSPLTVPRLRR